jgi:PAS domain S-box-containing protein
VGNVENIAGPFIYRICILSAFTVRFLLCATVVLAYSLCLETQYARADIQVVTVGVYENPPKIFVSESGEPSGIFIDIIRHIAKKEGWELRFAPGSWGEGLDRLERGEIDLMPDVAYSHDRAKIYFFHKTPVLSAWYQVYAQKGSNIRSMLDLNNKRILVLERSVQHAAFARLSKGFGLNSSLIPSPDYKSMFEIVARGEADAAIVNRFYGMTYAAKYGLEDTGIVFEPSDLFFAARKNAPAQMLEAIDRNLVAMKQDTGSAYYASLKKWTAEDVLFKWPAWLQIVGVIAGIALLMSLAGSFFLKHQVNARTRELRASERHYRLLFEQNPAPILIYERETFKMLAVNDAFLGSYGYGEEEVLAMSLPDLYPEEEKKPILELAQRLSGHAYVGEWHHHRKDGSLMAIVVRSHDITYHDRAARIAVITDITARKHAEDALRYSEQKFMKAFHATPDAIVISKAANGFLVEVNEVFLRKAGYSREEVLNKTTVDLTLWADPSDRERYVAGVREQGRVRDMEAQFRTKSGIILEGLVSGESIVLGSDLCLLTIIRDITERKKIEQELEKHRLHLEEMVNERTSELKAKIAEIERINKLFIDRELRMMELKDKIRELESKTNSLKSE